MNIDGMGTRTATKASGRSYLSYLECAKCNQTYSPHELHGQCTCGGPLLCRYQIEELRQDLRREDLVGRPATLWRYRELLPVQDISRAVTLGEGFTPLVPLQWGTRYGLRQLWGERRKPESYGYVQGAGSCGGSNAAA